MKKSGIYIVLVFLALIATIAAIFLLQPQPMPHSVTLTWHAPGPREGVTIVSYNVYRKTADSPSFTKIAEKVVGSLYEDHQVTSGKQYFYVLTSVDQNGRESRYSTAVTAEIP